MEVMPKVRSSLAPVLATGAAVLSCAPATAAPAGPDAAQCEGRATGPAMLVRVSGFKARTGSVRVQSYGGDPRHYFDKGSYLKRIDLRVPPVGGDLDVGVPVPAPGRYAVSVRHDVNGSGSSDRGDGGGLSGNPHMSLFDVILKRKPDPAQVQVEVGRGVRVVPIVLNYLSGASFRPVAE
jgi:uncharacterized protein (DUF2141 family)